MFKEATPQGSLINTEPLCNTWQVPHLANINSILSSLLGQLTGSTANFVTESSPAPFKHTFPSGTLFYISCKLYNIYESVTAIQATLPYALFKLRKLNSALARMPGTGEVIYELSCAL
jgi:hypothetical protein